MPSLRRVVRRLRATVRRKAIEREMDDEIRFHLEMRTAEHIAAGMEPEAARRDAVRRFGNVAAIKDAGRDVRGGGFVDGLLHDLRHALRAVARAPSHALVAAGTLALGIGAVTAIFSVVDAVLLRPLPYAQAERLVEIWNRSIRSQGSIPGQSAAAFTEWQRSGAFEQVEAFREGSGVLLDGAEPERISLVELTPGLLAMLGIPPALGSGLAQGGERLVLSEGLWRRRFGGDPAVLGRVLSVNGRRYEIAGVMPAAFRFPSPTADAWVPIARDAASAPEHVDVIARLPYGMSRAEAQARADAIGEALRERGILSASLTPHVAELQQNWVGGPQRRALLMLLGATAFVLMVACVNVAALALALGLSRQADLAIRSALGAARRRLLRQLLLEHAIIGAAGATLGALLAHAGVQLLVPRIPEQFTFLSAHPIAVDLRVLAFCGTVALATSLVFGLLPAVRCSRPEATEALKGTARSGPPRQPRSPLRVALAVAQVSLALVLLLGAGLLLRSFLHLQAVETGFDPAGIVAFTIELPASRYPGSTSRLQFFRSLQSAAAGVPRVRAVTVADALPLEGGAFSFGFEPEVEGRARPDIGGPRFFLPFAAVEPNYFSTMGIRLVRGRTFEPSDTRDTVIVNDVMARALWGDTSPLGRRFRLQEKGRWLTVVGVSQNVPLFTMDDARGDGMEMYYPHHEERRVNSYQKLIVRADGDPLAIVPAVKERIRALDGELPVLGIQTADDLVAQALETPRFHLLLVGIFAAVAALVAAVGIYGVIAQTARVRIAEFGVRMALGATPGQIRWLVLRDGALIGGTGVLLGIAGGTAATEVLRSFLFEVEPHDPLTLGVVAAAVLGVALVAAYIPSRRAVRADPLDTLRAQ